MATASSSQSASGATEPFSPSWPLIHFDVHCARCGHDLRGQTDPVCSACKLEFSWADAAPLEKLTCGECNYHLYGLADSRCPECGTSVDWNEVVLRYRRLEKPIFEYRWRDRPIRSFFRTWFLALRPKRLWRVIDLHDDPAVRPLMFWGGIVILLVAILTPILYGLAIWLNAYATQIPGGPFPITVADISQFAFRLFRFPEGYLFGVTILLYSVFSCAALLVFQQSLAKCQVRTSHVIRAACYTLVARLPFFGLLYLASEFGLFGVWNSSPLTQSFANSTLGIMLRPFLPWIVFAAIVTFALNFAYKRYIKMPHSFWVAASAQSIAVLGVAAFFSVLLRVFFN